MKNVSPAHDPVNHPTHYACHPSGVECITIARQLVFNTGNAVKYIWRAGEKGGASEIEDLRKALWYLEDHFTNRAGSTPTAECKEEYVTPECWKPVVGHFSYNRGRAIESICTGYGRGAIDLIKHEIELLESEQQQTVAAPSKPTHGRGNGKAVPAGGSVPALQPHTKVRGSA